MGVWVGFDAKKPGDVDQGYLDRVEALRNDDAKQKRQQAAAEEGAVIGLHNEVS